MKKWNKPELLSLGVENSSNNCTCVTKYNNGKPNKENLNYCHSLGEWHENNCASIGHHMNNGCKGTPECTWPGESHKSKCCCSTSIGTDAPGQS